MRQPGPSSDRTLLTAAVVAAIAWIGIVAIGVQLASTSSAMLGFDFQLLLQAGRDVAAGRSPYDPSLLAGGAPTATELFYSYPPPVAQAFALVGWLPNRVALVLWDGLAVAGLLVVADQLRRQLAPDRPRRVFLAVCAAAAPLTLPFAVGLLFGNLDVFFPLLYGTMLLAVIDGSVRRRVLAGVALALASLKLHPASMGLWFIVRAITDRGSGAWRVVGVAIGVGVAIVVASLLVGGLRPWIDYAQVVRGGTAAAIVDARNAGFAALIASAIGAGDATARSIHVGVGLLAVAITIWAAWRRGDAIEGFAWATAASLGTLPVTWYHYPSALIPIAIAAWLRADQASLGRVRLSIVAAMVVGAVAIAALPLLWVAIGLVILAVRLSRPVAARSGAVAPERPVPAAG
jgi:hypothetical protein